MTQILSTPCRFLCRTLSHAGAPDNRVTLLPPEGFTLIELILSLTILAAVASIVLTTAADLGERSRYEETERRGQMIRNAVIGTPEAPGRFAADLGRFPSVTDEAEGRELAELYDSDITTNEALRYATRELSITSSAAHFSFGGTNDFEGAVNPLGAAQVTLGAGWRGPYLEWRHEKLTDNWGRPWEIAVIDAGSGAFEWRPVEAGDTAQEIRGIRTLGRDGADEEHDLSAPNTYPDEIQTYAFSSNALFATLTVQVWTNGASHTSPVASNRFLRVFLYQPVCTREEAGVCEIAAWRNAPGAENADTRIQTDAMTAPVFYDGTNSTALAVDYPALHTCAHWGSAAAAWHTVTFTDVPVGIRKVWAYAYAPGESHGVRSPLTSLELRPGRTHLIDLYLTEPF